MARYRAEIALALCLLTTASAFSPAYLKRTSPLLPSPATAASSADLPGGSYCALVTPMKPGGAVDFDNLEKLLEWHVEEGSDGLVVLGTTGEAATMRPQERTDVIRAAVEVLGRSNTPCVIGTGTFDTRTTIEQTLEAQALGASGALVVTPFYNKPTQKGLVAHFGAVADAVVDAAASQTPMPLLLYNVPGRTGVDMLPPTVAAVAAKHPLYVGLKDASGAAGRLAALRASLGELGGLAAAASSSSSSSSPPPPFLLLSGEDGEACEWCVEGGDGVISVTANVAPRLEAAMIQSARSAFASGSALAADEARAMDARLAGLHSGLFCQSSPIPAKFALHQMGRLGSNALRMPLVPLEPEFEATVSAAVAQAGAA